MGVKTRKLSQINDSLIEWQSVVVADGSTGLTAEAGRGYFINTTGGAITVTLPSTTAKPGDTIQLKDYARTWDTNAVSIASNTFDGSINSNSFSTKGQTVTLIYMDNTKGWSLINEDTTSNLGPSFISATGGTVTTSGDFKIHSFTGDGCFVVATVGNPAGSDSVDYLVVAGGASGGNGCAGGGGGAGGFRMSNFYGLPAPTTSPLANPAGLPLSAQTYPITVGAGGAATTGGPGSPATSGNNGNTSIFSTVTSTGGGFGGRGQPTPNNAGPGGSGGGGGHNGGTGGTGNTPPTNPSQGNNGALSVPYIDDRGGGGGGAGGVAATPSPSQIQNGGIGSIVSPSFAVACAGTPGPAPGVRYFAGGGGGAQRNGPGGTPSAGAGGSGGGGAGGLQGNGTNATTNTGGGGGGAAHPSTASTSGSGGKGIVIIRYKFQ